MTSTSITTNQGEETTSGDNGILTSLRYFDGIRAANTTQVTREKNVEILTYTDQEDPSTIAICHLGGILPFTQGNKNPDQATFEEGAAVALAAHQLNVGDGSIVPEVEGLHKRCKIRFTVEFADTELEGGVGLKHVLEMTNRQTPQRLPCAFLGAYRSAVSIPTSIVSGLQGYVQVSGASTSADLDDTSQYPLFSRTVPSDHGNAIPMIQYMREHLGIAHLAVINVNDAYGNSFVEGLRIAAQTYAPGMVVHPIPLDWEQGGVETAIQVLKKTQFTFVFCLVFTAETHDALLLEAYHQGVAGTGQHNWLFADTFGGVLRHRLLEEGSPLHKAYQGVGALEASAGVAGMPDFDNFEYAINQLNNAQDLEYLSGIFPKHDDENYNTDFLYGDTFWGTIKRSMAQFDYEATIALGLAACSASEGGYSFTGREQFDYMISEQFHGLTSMVQFDSVGSRLPNTTLYKMTNYVAEQDPNNPGFVQFPGVVTDIFQGGAWQQHHDYIFNDGTTDLPLGLPPIEVDQGLIDAWTRGFTLGLCVLVWLMATGFSYWTQSHKQTRVVLASQPFFLQVICVGVFILAGTIIPVTIDTGVASIQGCNIACNAIPWLFFVGCSVVLSALFTKTFRINMILQNSTQFKRIKVSVQDVLKPMVCLLGINAFLLGLMTGLHPAQWEERVISEDLFGRPVETYGSCARKQQLPFIIALSLVVGGALFFTIVQAYKARHLSTEFSETQNINQALIAIVMVCFVGVPGIALAKDNPNAHVFVTSAVTFVFCAVMLLFIFVPKIISLKNQRKDEGKRIKITQDFSVFMTATDEDYEGMKILTTKSHMELARENEVLKQLLARWERKSEGHPHFFRRLSQKINRSASSQNGSFDASLRSTARNGAGNGSVDSFVCNQDSSSGELSFPLNDTPFASNQGSDTLKEEIRKEDTQKIEKAL